MVPRDFIPLLYEGIDLAGEGLFTAPGTCLKRMFELFSKQYGARKGGGRRGRVRRRDGHCCQAPGCTGRGKLHVHHLVFRSHGGTDAAWNLVLVCSACHRLIHLGLLRVSGRAPFDLVWTRACERWEKGRRVLVDVQETAKSRQLGSNLSVTTRSDFPAVPPGSWAHLNGGAS